MDGGRRAGPGQRAVTWRSGPGRRPRGTLIDSRATTHAVAVAPVVITSSRTTAGDLGRRPVTWVRAQPAQQVGRPRLGVQADRVGRPAVQAQGRDDPRVGQQGRAATGDGRHVLTTAGSGRRRAGRGRDERQRTRPDRRERRRQRVTKWRGQLAAAAFLVRQDGPAGRTPVVGQRVGRRQAGPGDGRRARRRRGGAPRAPRGAGRRAAGAALGDDQVEQSKRTHGRMMPAPTDNSGKAQVSPGRTGSRPCPGRAGAGATAARRRARWTPPRCRPRSRPGRARRRST